MHKQQIDKINQYMNREKSNRTPSEAVKNFTIDAIIIDHDGTEYKGYTNIVNYIDKTKKYKLSWVGEPKLHTTNIFIVDCTVSFLWIPISIKLTFEFENMSLLIKRLTIKKKLGF